ncbi:MAG: LON peptidase substrate-binding domain-containing protein [Gammaproteobacteria bacterium]|nr:LON peptidase substrate-binding domain-containing protein [Gammaproteobacteria bacterium]
MSDLTNEVAPAGAMATRELPLFPLQRTVFPGVTIPMRIFEQRYLRLVRESLATAKPFAVVPILSGREVGATPLSGREVGATPAIAERGTLVTIADWSQLPNGLLGIEVRGEQRLRVGATRVEADGLMRGEVMLDAPDQAVPLAGDDSDLVALLGDLARHFGVEARYLNDSLDGITLAWRLADLLPVALERKIALLGMADPLVRLIEVRSWVIELSHR